MLNSSLGIRLEFVFKSQNSFDSKLLFNGNVYFWVRCSAPLRRFDKQWALASIKLVPLWKKWGTNYKLHFVLLLKDTTSETLWLQQRRVLKTKLTYGRSPQQGPFQKAWHIFFFYFILLTIRRDVKSINISISKPESVILCLASLVGQRKGDVLLGAC